MNISAGAQLKVLIVGAFLGMVTLSYFILKPNDAAHDSSVAQAKVFGEYMAKNPHILLANQQAESETTAPSSATLTQPISMASPTPAGDTLSIEETEILKATFKEWSKKGAVRDSAWRGQVEGLLDLAERKNVEEVLDYIRPQIIFGRYDADEKNQVYTQVWIERYLRLEKRDFQKKQIQDLLLK